MKDLPPLRIKGECLIEPDDQILYALAPEMAEALAAVRVASADIACYCQDVRNGLRSGAGLLDLQERFASLNEQARAILARLPQAVTPRLCQFDCMGAADSPPGGRTATQNKLTAT